MAYNPQETPEPTPPFLTESLEKSEWRWDVIGGDHKGETFSYAPEFDVSTNVFDAARIIGPSGFIEQSPYKGNGRSYEHDLIGDAGDIPFVKLSSGKIVTLQQAYRALEKEKTRSKAVLDRKLFFAAAERVVEYFDALPQIHRELLHTEFLNDLERATADALHVHIKMSEKQHVSVRIYVSSNTPMDSFGVDFFVDMIGVKNKRRRIYCDLTLNANKDVARGFAQIVLANIHVPTSHDTVEEQRAYHIQVKMIANRLAHDLLRGFPQREYDVVNEHKQES